MFRMGPTLQLGVGHLIAEGPERRSPPHAFQKVRPTAPVARQERALKDDLSPFSQCRARGICVACQIVASDLDDILAGPLQPLQMRRFMRVALLLKERGILAVLAGLR